MRYSWKPMFTYLAVLTLGTVLLSNVRFGRYFGCDKPQKEYRIETKNYANKPPEIDPELAKPYDLDNFQWPKLNPKPVKFYRVDASFADDNVVDYVKNALNTTQKPDSIYLVTDPDDSSNKMELLAVTTESKERRFYFIDYPSLDKSPKLAGVTNFESRLPKDLKVVEMTGGGNKDIIFKVEFRNPERYRQYYGNYSICSVVISDELQDGIQTINTENHIIKDIDGNGIPEVHRLREYYTYVPEKKEFCIYKDIPSDLKKISEGLMLIAGCQNPQKKMRAEALLHELYSDDVLFMPKAMMLLDTDMRRSLVSTEYYRSLLSLPIKELLAIEFVRIASNAYNEYESQKREAELIKQYGGNPRFHVLQRDVNGNVVGLSERHDYTPNSYEQVQQFHESTEQRLNEFREYSSEKLRQGYQGTRDRMQDMQRDAQRNFQNFQRDAGRTIDNAGRNLQNLQKETQKSFDNFGKGLQDFFKKK